MDPVCRGRSEAMGGRVDGRGKLQTRARKGAAGVSGALGRVRSGDTFLFLFVLLIVTLGMAIIGTSETAGRVVFEVLSGATLLVTLLAAKASRSWKVAGWLVFISAVIVASASVSVHDAPLAAVTIPASHVALLLLCVPIVLRRLLQHEEVTGETIAGSLCVYLLLGLAFANLYLALSAAGDAPVLKATVAAEMPLVIGDYIYYSFIGMLTVGFGDVVPVTQWAKAATVVQAIFGQVVLLTLVARLVSVAQFRRFRQADAASNGPGAEDRPSPE